MTLPDRLPPLSAARFVLLFAALALLWVSFAQVGPAPEKLVQGLPNMGKLVSRMMPPNLEADFLLRMGWKVIETLQIALVGALIGIVLSLPLAFLAARNLSPFGRGGMIVKAVISFFRTVPDLVWALLFVASIGLGAVAGTLTLVVDTIGFCGRFFAQAMEESEKEPQEALETFGASKLSVFFSAILPDIAPSLVNTSLFALEKAIRASVVLGLVGAGGIGQELKVAFDLFQYRNAATIILIIFIVVLLMEWLTERLRSKLS